jgi:hypothetical protein
LAAMEEMGTAMTDRAPSGAGSSTTRCLYYKQVIIVIYNCNDIGLYYKTRDDHN